MAAATFQSTNLNGAAMGFSKFLVLEQSFLFIWLR